MNCSHHHKMIDDHVIQHRYLTDRKADGAMEFWLLGAAEAWQLWRDSDGVSYAPV